MSLSLVVRVPSGFGVDVAFYPLESLEIGFQVTSWLFVSEASAYVRYVAFFGGQNGFNVGLRADAINSLLESDDDAPPGHALLSVEAGYEHRAGASFFGVEIGTATWFDGNWFPHDPPVLMGELRLGHLW